VKAQRAREMLSSNVMGRRFIGIDPSPAYVESARERVESAVVDGGPLLLTGHGNGRARRNWKRWWQRKP
jgi:hypothetical protein